MGIKANSDGSINIDEMISMLNLKTKGYEAPSYDEVSSKIQEK